MCNTVCCSGQNLHFHVGSQSTQVNSIHQQQQTEDHAHWTDYKYMIYV